MPPACRLCRVAAGVSQLGELIETGDLEPCQPNTFALALAAHPVHTVVPVAGVHQGQAMDTKAVRPCEGAEAVVVQRAGFRRRGRQTVVVILAGLENWSLQVRDGLIENRRIAGHGHIVNGDKRKPERIVGDSGTNAAPQGWVPPMLDVPLGILPGRGPEDMGPRLLRSRVEKRHHILELVAKTIGSARLVKGGTPPDATAQHLIEQPAVDQEVERWLGGTDLDRLQAAHPTVPERLAVPAAALRPRGTVVSRTARRRSHRPRPGERRSGSRRRDQAQKPSGSRRRDRGLRP